MLESELGFKILSPPIATPSVLREVLGAHQGQVLNNHRCNLSRETRRRAERRAWPHDPRLGPHFGSSEG